MIDNELKPNNNDLNFDSLNAIKSDNIELE